MAETESKHDKFKRIASRRVQKAIKDIGNIKNLSKSSYEYTEEEVEKIFNALQGTLDDTRNAFKGQKSEKKAFEF